MTLPRLSGAACLAALVAAGCSYRPAAPVLSNARVYQNADEGFRFLVPDGWNQTASSVLPPGGLTNEVFLTRYNLSTAEPGAVFVVLCMDEKAAGDPAEHHAGPSFRVDRWKLIEPAKTIDVHGVPAERMVYQAALDNSELTKFVTCFRRNGRLYSFVGLFSSRDDMARQEVERAAADVIWTP